MRDQLIPSDVAPPRLAERQFGESLPLALVSVLERRYLADFQPLNWSIAAPDDAARPLLRELVGLGRPEDSSGGLAAMPAVLAACHDPGHSLVMALHGDGERHRIYFGGKRLVGSGARSTEDYLFSQEGAFKAHLAGLRLGGARKLDAREMPGLSGFLSSAPALAAVTGIPSRRDGKPGISIQSLDSLVRALGNQRYAVIVAAEPLDAAAVDETLDACRRLKGQIHAYIRRSIAQTKGGSEAQAQTVTEQADTWTNKLPYLLYGLAVFSQFTGVLGASVPIAAALAQKIHEGATAMAGTFQASAMGASLAVGRETAGKSRQVTSGENWSESGSAELLDANAEACEQLLQAHIDRLQSARSDGWWRTAIYVVAENEAVMHSVGGALRSHCGGPATRLDPIRLLPLPVHLMRRPASLCQVARLTPAEGGQTHPLGAAFDSLATCVNSDELSVLVSVPRREIPGLPMRDQSDFALTAAPPTEDSIVLGSLQDGVGREVGTVSITAGSLNRHLFVTGINGSGKTNTCTRILLEAYEKLGIPFLVIEPAKAEYRSLSRSPLLAGKLGVYSLGGPSPVPFRLNPLAPVNGVPLGRHIDLLKAVFNASFPMFAGMSYVLEDALLEVYSERGWSLYTSDNPFLGRSATLDERSSLTPCLEDLHDKIESVLERKNYGQEIHRNLGAALRSRLRSLIVGNKGLALNTRRSTPLEDLFCSPTVIELENLGDDEEKAFVMAILLGLLYEYAEVRQRDQPDERRGRLQHITLVEEAHRLLAATRGAASPEVGDPRGKAVSMFTDMLAEMRAYGEGFIIADQIPTKLAPETLKNTNLKIVHRLVAPDDREIAGSCMNLTDWQKRHLNNLAPGIAIVHDERIGEAVQTAVVLAKVGNPVADRNPQAECAATTGPGQRLYLYRHAGCRKCPSPCDFYHRLSEIARESEIAAKIESVLDSVYIGDLPAAWERWLAYRGLLAGSIPGRVRPDRDSLDGLVYCKAVETAEKWLGEMIAGRGRQIGSQSLTPDDRLARDTAARAFGELFGDWLGRAESGKESAAAFGRARETLLHAIAEAPLHEASGCGECPARCLMLPFVTAGTARVGRQISQMLAAGQNPAASLVSIERVTAPVEQTVPLLNGSAASDERHRLWLYCMLANVPATGAADALRQDLLGLLCRPVPGDETEIRKLFGG